MDSDIKDLNYVFKEMPIYSTEVFQILNLNLEKNNYYINQKELDRLYTYLNTESRKLIINCVWCNKEFSFNYNSVLYLMDSENSIYQENSIRLAFIGAHGIEFIPFSNSLLGPLQETITYRDLIEKNYYISYYISCNNVPYHVYTLNLLFRVEKDKIIVTKVGQYPSLLSVKGFDFDRYKKQLKKYNAYDDYKNANLSMSNNFFTGAYTYLRRVYEKQLNFYIENDKPQLSDDRTETKIKAVKHNFDPRIHEHLGNLYKILSIGIHELDDEECKEYYIYLKAMIDMQLQFEKSKEETEKQSKLLNINISNITTKLQQRKSNKST